MIHVRTAREALRIETATRPLVVAVDAAFDVLRIPHRDELPPSLAEALDAAGAVAVIGEAVPDELVSAYGELAARMQARVVEAGAVPGDAGAVWVLGRGADPPSSPWAAMAGAVAKGAIRVMVVREPGGRPRVLLHAESAAAVRALASRLPHDGRYGLLGFDGDSARNVFKGEQAPEASPLHVVLDPAWRAREVPLPPEQALTPP